MTLDFPALNFGRITWFDDAPATCVVIDPYVPVNEIWVVRGVAYASSVFAERLGPSDDAFLIGTNAWPAWTVGPRQVTAKTT
jgi:hypothetical protein